MRQERKTDDADENREQRKAGSTARMRRIKGARTVRRQRLPLLHSKNYFMLRAVIFEDAANIGFAANHSYIEDENDQLDRPLDEVEGEPVGHSTPYRPGRDPVWQP